MSNLLSEVEVTFFGTDKPFKQIRTPWLRVILPCSLRASFSLTSEPLSVRSQGPILLLLLTNNQGRPGLIPFSFFLLFLSLFFHFWAFRCSLTFSMLSNHYRIACENAPIRDAFRCLRFRFGGNH